MKVHEIMSRRVIAVTPGTGIKEAAGLLVERGISALPVLDSKGALVGIVSEADLIAPETGGSGLRLVGDVMTRDVLTVSASCEVTQAARIMLDAGIKRVPVLRARRVVGILSRRDLVRVLARSDGESLEVSSTVGR
jgi:CBS domain-containing protein